jgi:hypothetical protein
MSGGPFALDSADLQRRPVEDAIGYFRRTGQSWQTADALRVLCLMQQPRESLPT